MAPFLKGHECVVTPFLKGQGFVMVLFFFKTEVCFVEIFQEIGVFVLVKYIKGQEFVLVKFSKRTRVCVFVTLFSSSHI